MDKNKRWSCLAQDAAALWGIMAAGLNKRWAWVLAFVIAFFVGFSRLYLGVHFVHDVIAGWLIGSVILFAFPRSWDPVAAWLKTKTLPQQIILAFVISLVVIGIGGLSTARLHGYVFPAEWTDNALRAGPLPDPVSIEGIITSAGSLFGLPLVQRGSPLEAGPRPQVRWRNGLSVMVSG